MVKKVFLFLLLFLIFLFAGCVFQEKEEEETVIIKKPGYLEANILMNIEGDTIYISEKFRYPIYIVAKICNNAELPTKGVICLDGLNTWENINGPLCTNFELEKAYNESLPRCREYLLAEEVYPPIVKMETKENVILSVCYAYNTSILLDFCIYTDKNPEEKCKYYIYSPSAPIVLKNFDFKAVNIENYTIKKFFIGEIEFKGEGILFNDTSFLEKRSCTIPERHTWRKINFRIVSNFEELKEKYIPELESILTECQPVGLSEKNTAIFYCTITFEFNKPVSEIRAKYGDYIKIPLRLEFSYSIYDKVSKEIILKPLIT